MDAASDAPDGQRHKDFTRRVRGLGHAGVGRTGNISFVSREPQQQYQRTQKSDAFVDGAVVHSLTTATVDRLRVLSLERSEGFGLVGKPEVVIGRSGVHERVASLRRVLLHALSRDQRPWTVRR